MPNFPHLCAVVLVSTFMGPIYAAQHDVTVEESDSALVYTPLRSVWEAIGNPQTRGDGTVDSNYYHGGGYVCISLPGATVSLTFNGSYIAYYSDKNNDHGSMTITLDNKTTTLNTFNAAGAVPQVKIFESFVDPDIPDHTITLTCLESWTMGLDYFLYTAATPATKIESLIASSTSSPVTSPIRHPASPSSNTGPGIIVAALLAAIGWAVAFLFALLFLRLRRRSVASKASPPEPQYLQHSMSTSPSPPAAITEHPSLPRSCRAQSNEFALTREFAAGVCTDVLFASEVSHPQRPSNWEDAEIPISVAAVTTRNRISLQSPPAYSEDP